ncbi:hypothetical protein EDC04DRAFT_2612176 [Pisolithus marmoratus]|nr:hypothetical protein EDC04DRAFT_2612176 [Pisolithus marmoratus]
MEASELRDICGWITTGMSNQHSTDLGSIKHTGLTYVLCDGEMFDPPIGKGEDKTTCRFNYPQIACLLCPWKKLESFDEDPDIIIAALQEGLIKTSTCNWPTVFYAEGVYDPENKLKGLFCSVTAFQFYMHLFIGPSAAVTNTIGLTEVTLYIIAYVHVVVHITYNYVFYFEHSALLCACKTKCLSMLECRAAEAIEFGMPPPPEAPKPEARPSASFTALSASPDLTPCPLDQEDESLIAKMTNTIPSGATSTAVNTAQSAMTSAGCAWSSNITASKKAIAPQTKQPCWKTTKKKNGF